MSAVKEQLENGWLYGTPTEAELKLAGIICTGIPSIEMLRLVNTGTEATMSAIRAARGYTRKKKIVKFEGCYHGAHDAVLVKAGSGAAASGVPNSEGIPEETTRNTIVVPYNDVHAFDDAIRQNADIGAVIMEPVMGNMGVISPREGFLEHVRELTNKKDIVLIFDEVITGFRLAFGGAQEYYGVKPDMTTLGKVLGGGFPIAAYGGKKEIMQNIAPIGGVYQAGTYSGNPISVTAGVATLKAIREKGKGFYKHLEDVTKSITESAREAQEEKNLPIQINQIASMFQIFFTKEPVINYKSAKSCDSSKYTIFHQRLLKEGVFFPPSQSETCFVSTEHSRTDTEHTTDAIQKALEESLST
jgi:glutamate-1-semialdehyde 2,1-aminomutase